MCVCVCGRVGEERLNERETERVRAGERAGERQRERVRGREREKKGEGERRREIKAVKEGESSQYYNCNFHTRQNFSIIL